FAFIRDTVQPHYRTLLDCWSAIDRAERQIVLLRPVADCAERIRNSETRIEGWRRLQDLARPYFITQHLTLLRAQALQLASALELSEAARRDAAGGLSEHRRERDDVNAAINATDVGPRLQAIQRELEYAEDARRRAQHRRDRIEPAA